jgi:CheY-like chemotaxis protein
MRLLIVDDDPVLAEALAALVAPEVESTICSSVDDAIDSLSQEAPDCVLIDVAMPDGGGVAVYRWLRANQPALATRAIFMTGYPEAFARKILGDLSNPLLLKPFAHLELLETLGATTDRA